MRVSIITACYNRAETIGNAIESVLRQTYHDIEYIVVDGCSTDGSAEIICHSDDLLYDEHTVERVVEAFEKHPEADMMYANGIFVNSENGNVVRVWKGKRMKRWLLRCGWLPLHTTCYVRKKVFERYGLYDESYRIAADTKFLLAVLYQHRIHTAFLPQYVVKMQMGGASTDMNRQQEMWKEDIRVFKEMGFRFPVWMKLMKMVWKPSQFIKGKLMKQVR